MSFDNTARPVELLRDGRGIYGIGVSDLFDHEAVAWSCGVEPDDVCHWGHSAPRALILRPDRLFVGDKRPYRSMALQKITGGFRHGPFSRCGEEHLRQFIHHEALHRAGLPWPPPDQRWWSTDEKQQACNRRTYHGLRQVSLCVINKLIDQALEEAADADAIRAARRFYFGHREHIYRAAATSRRALQLTETFPVLTLAIYSDPWGLRRVITNWTNATRMPERDADLADRKRHAVRLVDQGARLRDVAAVMNIPMALRRIKPGVAHFATDLFCDRPDLLDFMPDGTPQQRIWLRVVNWACKKVDFEFGAWAARHVAEIPGRRDQVVGSFISDLSHWARPEKGAGRQFITRPFEPSMSLKTVTALSAEWHEAVAANMTGPDVAFPAPWYPPATIGDYAISPIEDSAALYLEGAAMHHCIGTYAERVHDGGLYAYSVRRDGERLATFTLARSSSSAIVSEIRGPCNAQPDKQIVATVRRWLRAQAPLPPPCPVDAHGDSIPF